MEGRLWPPVSRTLWKKPIFVDQFGLQKWSASQRSVVLHFFIYNSLFGPILQGVSGLPRGHH